MGRYTCAAFLWKASLRLVVDQERVLPFGADRNARKTGTNAAGSATQGAKPSIRVKTSDLSTLSF